MKFCKRTFQGYSSKLNKSREKSFCLSKRKKEKTMNPNNLSRDHHRDKYNSVARKENSQNSCFLVKKILLFWRYFQCFAWIHELCLLEYPVFRRSFLSMKTHTEHEMGHLVYVISQADVHSFFLHCKNQRVGQYLNVNKCNVFKSSRQLR